MLQYKSSKRSSRWNSEPVCPQLNKEGNWVRITLGSKCSLQVCTAVCVLRFPTGIIKLQTAWGEHTVIDLWWKTLNNIKTNQTIWKKYKLVASDRENDCTLKTDLRYPVPELKQLKQTRLRLPRQDMGFHHEEEFALANWPTSPAVFREPSVEPEISWPITVLPHHGGRSISHTSDL